MSYYEPLTRFLEGRSVSEIMLTFREVEGIIGRNLPASARKHQAWWANTSSHSHAEAWLRLDWKTLKVDLAGERVRFARATGFPQGQAAMRVESHDRGDASVVMNLDQLTGAGRKLFRDYAEDMNGDTSAVIARAFHEAAIARRGRLIDDIVSNAPRMPAGEPDSVQLIREDRDAR